MGFCEDYKPDDKVYKIQEGFFISSQDGAQNLEELKGQKITHILNVGSGIENAFPQVRRFISVTYSVHENTEHCILKTLFKASYIKWGVVISRL